MNTAGDRQAIVARYAEGPAHLERAIAGLSDPDLDARPSQGGWTIREIVHHVVDGDDLFKICIKAAMGNESGEITFMWYWDLPQDTWAQRWAYAVRSLDVSLALMRASRAHVAQLLEHVPDAWSRSIGFRKHSGEIVQLTVATAIENQANHVPHHVERILAIRQELGCA